MKISSEVKKSNRCYVFGKPTAIGNQSAKQRLVFSWGNQRSSTSPWRTSCRLVWKAFRIAVSRIETQTRNTKIPHGFKAQPTLWQSPEGFPMMPCKILFFFWERSRCLQLDVESQVREKIRNCKRKNIFLRKIPRFLTMWRWRQQKTQNSIMNFYLKFVWV